MRTQIFEKICPWLLRIAQRNGALGKKKGRDSVETEFAAFGREL
jgi:hypothetical protein